MDAGGGLVLAATWMWGLAGAWGAETEIRYLSGQGKDDAVSWDFFCTAGRKSGEWTTIRVPSCWELEGFGTYNYGHDPQKATEQGRYRLSFDVPAAWRSRRSRSSSKAP